MKLFHAIFLLLLSIHFCDAQNLQRRGRLGVQMEPVTDSLAQVLGLQEAWGMAIRRVFPGATYANAGGMDGDVLLNINGLPAVQGAALQEAMQSVREGRPARFTVWRNGEKKELEGAVSPIPLETSASSDVIYGEVPYKGGWLRAIVNKPHTPGPHPAIYFIPGYTCSSVESFSPIHPYKKLLDSLSGLGYAIFRVEKPGVGDNVGTGNCQELGFDNELEAYRIAYEAMKQYDFIDMDNVFIWGHSMGGVYAPIIGAQTQPKGVVVYGITHEVWVEYLLKMVRYQNPLLGHDYVETDLDVRTLYALLYEHYYLGKSSKELYKNPDYQKILDRDFAFDGEDQILFRHEDFWRELNAHNLSEAWAGINGHVLSLFGKADMEAVNDESQREIARIVNANNAGYGTFRLVPETDHSMIKVGSMEKGARLRSTPEYRQYLETKFNYEIVTVTHEWIQSVIGMER